MTGRSVPEWIGLSPDTAIPPRVRARVFEAADGRCTLCTRKIAAGEGWQADHIVALVNGGENREANLRCVCDWCHRSKTRADVAEKAHVARVRSKHIGAKPKSRRPIPGSKSTPYKRRVNGETVRRAEKHHD